VSTSPLLRDPLLGAEVASTRALHRVDISQRWSLLLDFPLEEFPQALGWHNKQQNERYEDREYEQQKKQGHGASYLYLNCMLTTGSLSLTAKEALALTFQ
jgi:hypothetical protein